MTSGSAGSVLMGLAYLALVVFLLLFCGWRTTTYDDFAKYWALFGTIVGIITGVIPAYFFKVQADRRADREAEKAQLFASAANTADITEIRRNNPELFGAP